MITQTVVKFSGSQYKAKKHICGKGVCREEGRWTGLWGVKRKWGVRVIRMHYVYKVVEKHLINLKYEKYTNKERVDLKKWGGREMYQTINSVLHIYKDSTVCILYDAAFCSHIAFVKFISIAIQGYRLAIFTFPFYEYTTVCCLSLFSLIPK